MRKLLLLMFALLTSLSGAWATSPAAGAYPVEGKTYYLFGNKYNSTDRYYLYWDDTNSVLKNAENSKKNNDFYKWTVTKVDEGVYTITNVGTGKKLAWSSGLTLDKTGLDFTLSQTVDYTACVSLYANLPVDGNRWCALKNDTRTFANGYKYITFPSEQSNYTVNFVFEEVLPAHSLTDGSYYTIYCDNDNKQYMYDNAGTLAQTNSAPASDLRYVWQCIVNGEYYNFRNVQSGKYLSHKAISTSANDFSVETADIYHDGCVKLHTKDGNYMGWKTDGTVDQASHPRFPKVTTDYSFDYRFDAVDMSAWCVGDKLGGTMSDGDWKSSWTSGTTPSFTLTASANNINNTSGSYTGGLDIRSGKNVLSSTYTLKAPDGYFITGYKLVGKALNGDQTVTPDGGTATVFTSNGNSMSVSGLNTQQTSFILTGANNGLFLHAMKVDLEAITSVTSLNDLSNSKKYNIINNRGWWAVGASATDVNSTVELSLATSTSDTKQQFAFIYYDDATDDSNDGYYLYSVSESKFVYKNGSKLSLSSLTDGNTPSKVTFTASTNTTYKSWATVIVTVDGTQFGVSTGKSPDVFGYDDTGDGGNAAAIYETGTFDATDALAALQDYFHPTHTITYVVKDSENNTLFTSDPVGAPIGTTYNTLPSEYHRDYFYTYGDITPVTITAQSPANTNVEVVATAKTVDLQYTADATSPIYYNLNIRGKYLIYDDDAIGDVTLEDNSLPFNSYAAWAFIGDPYTGFKIINQEKGTGFDLTYTSVVTGGNGGSDGSNNNVQFVADADFNNRYWLVESNSGGICLRMKENTNIYFHHQNITNTNGYLRTCSVSEWSSVHNDVGSTIVFGSDEKLLQDLYEELQYVFFGDAIGLYSNNSGLDNEEARAHINGAGSALQFHATSAYKDLYDALHTIKEQMSHGYITLNTPAAGYYRLKNVATGEYLKATSATSYSSQTRGVYANGNNTEAATVIRLYDKDNDGHLYMYNQGHGFSWVDANKAYGQGIAWVSSNTDKYVNWFLGKAAGQISFAICYGNGTGEHYAYLERGIYTANTADDAVLAGTSYTVDAAQWVVEPATSVTVNLNNGGDGFYYATCFADFPVSYTGASNGEGLFVLTGGENNNKVTAQKVDAVPAQQGFLIRLAAENVTESKVTLTIPASADALTGENVLRGTCLATSKPDGNVYVFSKVGDDLGFFPYTGTDNIPANRAYIVEPAGSGTRSFILSFDDTTGINGVSTSMPAGTIFDMQGRRVNKAEKGLYIVNGKKVLF